MPKNCKKQNVQSPSKYKMEGYIRMHIYCWRIIALWCALSISLQALKHRSSSHAIIVLQHMSYCYFCPRFSPSQDPLVILRHWLSSMV